MKRKPELDFSDLKKVRRKRFQKGPLIKLYELLDAIKGGRSGQSKA